MCMHWRWGVLLAKFALSCALLVGCGGLSDLMEQEDPAEPAVESDDFVSISEETTDEERRYLEAGRPIMVALGDGDFTAFYDSLSSHAKARMSQNQIVPADDKAEYRNNEQEPLESVSRETLLSQVQQVVDTYGAPDKPIDLYCESTDAEVLSGKGEALDVMFAIGSMPASVPAEIRRASLRGQIQTQLSSEQIEQVAKEYGITPEEVEQDDELRPYFTIKLVLVDEGGQLKVGYFEILPPSILD